MDSDQSRPEKLKLLQIAAVLASRHTAANSLKGGATNGMFERTDEAALREGLQAVLKVMADPGAWEIKAK